VCVCIRDLDDDALCRNAFRYNRDLLVLVDLNATFGILIQARQCTCNVLMRRIRAIIVAVEKQ